jgi:thiamine kinase-like enzyme
MNKDNYFDKLEIRSEIEKTLSVKLGKNIKIKTIDKIGTDYHSDGYRIETKDGSEFFLKRIKIHDVGFEFPERKISSLLVSDSMANRFNHKGNIKSFGVYIKDNKKKIEAVPEVNFESEIFQIQEFGGIGKSYLDILNENIDKKSMDEKDKKEIDKIVEYIVKIHKLRHPSKDKKILNAVYNDFLRNVIGHPEYILQLFHEIPKENIVLSPEKQGEFLTLMIENMHHNKNKSDRLRAIHGDFWGANIFFQENGKMFVIDHSRMPWGEAGFDIGIFLGSYLVKYIATNNKYYKEMGEYFLSKYIEKSEDKDIMDNIVYALGLIAVIYSSPVHVPDITDETRRIVFERVVKMLKDKKFSWD